MSKPIISVIAAGFLFQWEEEHLNIKVSHLHPHNDGRVNGELLITTTSPGYSPHLHQADFNFKSTTTRERLAKYMSQRYSEANWDNVLEQVCVHVLANIRQGEPAKLITSEDDITKPQYLLYPIAPLGLPTVLFGEAGSAKSYIALLFAIVSCLPWEDNPIGVIPHSKGHLPLYLDWEMSEQTLSWRLKQLTKGCDLPYIHIPYRFCTSPLADDIERIQEVLIETKAEFIIIDSLGAAAGGDLNTPETALRFFAALRQLKTTALILAHTSKDQQTKSKSIFGSVFFWNYARSIDEVRANPESNTIDIALLHRKSNIGPLHRPLGLRLTFLDADNAISAQSCDIRSIPELAEHLSLTSRIREALRQGAMLHKELIAELGIDKEKLASFNVTLSREKKKGNFIQLPDNRWALPQKEVT